GADRQHLLGRAADRFGDRSGGAARVVETALAGRAVRAAGVHEDRADQTAAALELLAADDHVRAEQLVAREQRGGRCGAVGDEQAEVEAAALLLDAGVQSGGAEALRQRDVRHAALVPRLTRRRSSPAR